RLGEAAAVPGRLAHHDHGRQLRRLHDARLRVPLRPPDRERRGDRGALQLRDLPRPHRERPARSSPRGNHARGARRAAHRAWMHSILEDISPLNHIDKITKPLMVVTGKNDPRVPWTEGQQIVADLKKRGTPVWWILANDEGHGYAKKPNADYQFYATVEFAKQT